MGLILIYAGFYLMSLSLFGMASAIDSTPLVGVLGFFNGVFTVKLSNAIIYGHERRGDRP